MEIGHTCLEKKRKKVIVKLQYYFLLTEGLVSSQMDYAASVWQAEAFLSSQSKILYSKNTSPTLPTESSDSAEKENNVWEYRLLCEKGFYMPGFLL